MRQGARLIGVAPNLIRMVDFTDQQKRDILVFRGLNMRYDEIATALSEEHGIDVSDSQVGTTVRELEDRGESEGYKNVFREVVAHGIVADMFRAEE